MKSPIPENEQQRLRTLKLYRILDTAAEKTLDDLTHLAAAICETPVGMISLVDQDRQWFKSRVGVEATETPREIAFCAHGIMDGKSLFIVEDATKDERFADNPLVTGEMGVRFYAGAPLVVGNGDSGGGNGGDIVLGMLCVADHKPRRLNEQQKETLKILSRAVVTQFELLRAQEDLRAIERLVPICAWCRNIRTDDGKWQSLHDYIAESFPVTHGMCPDCADGMSLKLKSIKKS